MGASAGRGSDRPATPCDEALTWTAAHGCDRFSSVGGHRLTGGFAGGQAEYVRVPFADFGPMKVPSHLRHEQVLFLSDITPRKVVAVWGAGPVGQLAIASARMLGAERIIAIDRLPYRLKLATERPAQPT